MGNGPSLNKLDLSQLEGENVFALNRCSLLFDRIKWRPKFYCAFDLTVIPDNLDEFNDLEIAYKFFSTKHKGSILEKENHYFYHDNSSNENLDKKFADDPRKQLDLGFGGGGTVATTAIQIAYFLGFDPIILIGCDCSYNVMNDVKGSGPDKYNDGVPLFLKSQSDNDLNHFDPRYFGKGKRWHNPNAEAMIEGFEGCGVQIYRNERTILNATIGGRLDAVARVDYENLLIKSTKVKEVGVFLCQDIAYIPSGMKNAIISIIDSLFITNLSIEIKLFIRNDRKDAPLPKRLMERCTVERLNKGSNTSGSDYIIYPFNNCDSEGFDLDKHVKISFIHDLIPIHFNYPDNIQKEYLSATKQADLFISPSNDIAIEIRKLTKKECIVVPPSIEPIFYTKPFKRIVSNDYFDLKTTKKRCAIKFDYMIYPAAFRKHKNHDILLEAIRYTYTNLSLVFCTGETHNNKLAQDFIDKIIFRNLSHRVRVVLGMDRKEYLSALYHSKGLVFPSLFEGFGIPVHECQALGIPVISTRCGGLSSSAAGSVEIKDPDDPKHIAQLMNSLYEDEELRSSTIERGLENAQKFTPEIAGSNFIKGLSKF
jgi:glycosyltransferase involved in cell wall biosynthesis